MKTMKVKWTEMRQFRCEADILVPKETVGEGDLAVIDFCLEVIEEGLGNAKNLKEEQDNETYDNVTITDVREMK